MFALHKSSFGVSHLCLYGIRILTHVVLSDTQPIVLHLCPYWSLSSSIPSINRSLGQRGRARLSPRARSTLRLLPPRLNVSDWSFSWTAYLRRDPKARSVQFQSENRAVFIQNRDCIIINEEARTSSSGEPDSITIPSQFDTPAPTIAALNRSFVFVTPHAVSDPPYNHPMSTLRK